MGLLLLIAVDLPNEVLHECIENVRKELDELEERHDFLSEALDCLVGFHK